MNVQLTNREFIRREIQAIGYAKTTEEKIAIEEGLENYIVAKLDALAAAERRLEAMRQAELAMDEAYAGCLDTDDAGRYRCYVCKSDWAEELDDVAHRGNCLAGRLWSALEAMRLAAQEPAKAPVP